MSFTKRDIAKNISSDTGFSIVISKRFLDDFIELVIKESKNKTVKISKFGSFKMKSTPKRIGRNPKTKKEYIISKREKLNFVASNLIRHDIN